MARKRKIEGIDEVLEEKADEYESGMERKQDSELDDLIWEQGRYEDKEPLFSETLEFSPENRTDEIPIEEQLTEKEFDGESLVEISEYIPQTDLLRIELNGKDLEVACGEVMLQLKSKVEEYCEREKIDIGDVWYDNKTMRQIWRNWMPWYTLDTFFHEIGLSGRGLDDLIWRHCKFRKSHRFRPGYDKNKCCGQGNRTSAKKGKVPVVAGTVSDGRYSYELDIAGEFDPGKLEFSILDLSDLGISDPLLTEVLYDGNAMYFEHEDFSVKDMLEVKFLVQSERQVRPISPSAIHGQKILKRSDCFYIPEEFLRPEVFISFQVCHFSPSYFVSPHLEQIPASQILT